MPFNVTLAKKRIYTRCISKEMESIMFHHSTPKTALTLYSDRTLVLGQWLVIGMSGRDIVGTRFQEGLELDGQRDVQTRPS